MSSSEADVVRWLQRIQAEYLGWPGLRLTKPQAQRLWGLDACTCHVLLEALVDAHFLTRTDQDVYILAGATRY